jgi:hypothetical protein
MIGNSARKETQPLARRNPALQYFEPSRMAEIFRRLDAQKELFAKDDVTTAAVFGSIQVAESFVQDLSFVDQLKYYPFSSIG